MDKVACSISGADSIHGVIFQNIDLQATVQNETNFKGEVKLPKTVYENDYEKLKNLPTLNGETFIGDVNEKDPTVPGWAKENSKPNYTPEEIGALGEDDEMSASTMVEIWHSIFN